MMGIGLWVCCVQGLGEGERSQLLNEAAKYVVEHLFGQRSQRSKVGTRNFVTLHDMHNTPRSWLQTVLGIYYCMLHITGGALVQCGFGSCNFGRHTGIMMLRHLGF